MVHSPSGPPIYWFLRGTPALASARLQGYLIHSALVERGQDSSLLLAPPMSIVDLPWHEHELPQLVDAVRGGVVVLQKLRGARALAFARLLAKAAVRTVYVQCDLEPENEVPYACTAVICPTEGLAELYRERGCHVHVIPDPIEHPARALPPLSAASETTRLAWVGHSSNWPALAPLRQLLGTPEFSDFQLVTVSNHEDADFPWSLDGVEEVVRTCDIGVVPVAVDDRTAMKSNNRATLFMGLGLPVVVDDIPAYRAAVRSGADGFVCRSAEDWAQGLSALRNPARRREFAERALASSRAHYGLEVIAAEWAQVLTNGNSPTPARDANDGVQSTHGFDRDLAVRASLRFAVLAIKRREIRLAARSIGDCLRRLPWTGPCVRHVTSQMLGRRGRAH